MSETVKVGHLIEGTEYKDAIHIAIAPVVAVWTLMPGEHIGFVDEGDVTRVGPSEHPKFEKAIGIVDPFLEDDVMPGQKFFMFLYPNTITGLRHAWTHPAFTKALSIAREKLS